MCGIIGYTGPKQAQAILVEGLRWARAHGLPEEAMRDYRVYVP